MTTTEFLRQLVSVRHQFDWTLTADTGHQAERRSTPRFHLQADPKARPGMTMDPIRAVVCARSGIVPDTWTEAAIVLGVTPSDANALAAAASDRTWTGAEGERAPSDELLELREQLLEAVGLVSWSSAPESRIFEKSDFSPGIPVPNSD